MKLIAPFEWRVHRTRDRLCISDLAARKIVAESDEKRRLFMSFFKGDKPDNELFDITLNRATLTEDEIMYVLMYLTQSKRIV